MGVGGGGGGCRDAVLWVCRTLCSLLHYNNWLAVLHHAAGVRVASRTSTVKCPIEKPLRKMLHAGCQVGRLAGLRAASPHLTNMLALSVHSTSSELHLSKLHKDDRKSQRQK